MACVCYAYYVGVDPEWEILTLTIPIGRDQ